MKTCILTYEEQQHFDPVAFTKKLKAAGFRFDSDECPVKITRPWEHRRAKNGDVIYTQWEGFDPDYTKRRKEQL